MINGKCPSCQQTVRQARLEHMDVTDGRLVVSAFSAACPSCNTILGVITDPRPMDQALEAIQRALRTIR